MTFGRRLAALRRERGLTQAQLAKRLGWAQVQVARIEAAHHEILLKTLWTYLDGVGYSIEFRDWLDEEQTGGQP